MSSFKAQVSFLAVTTILLILFAGFTVWLPSYLEEKAAVKIPLSQRISMLESVIAKVEHDSLDNEQQIVQIFRSQIESEKATEASFNSIIQIYVHFSSVLVWILFIHLIALSFVIKSLVKVKTGKLNRTGMI